MKKIIVFCVLLLFPLSASAFDWVIVKYRSGDWYNARAGVEHFLSVLAQRTTITVNPKPYELSLDDERIFEHAFLFINGHVPIYLNDKEKSYFRRFVLGGGFVFANDDYGMDKSFMKLISDIFPDYKWVQIPFTHPIYHSFYDFPRGVPKIHKHDGGPPRAYGLFVNGRIAMFYDANADVADGWDAYEVHHDPASKREAALRMGINVVVYALSH